MYWWGNFDHGSSVVRNETHQHYNSYQQMPEQQHPMWGDVFPIYARGSVWIMSSDLLDKVVDAWVDERNHFEKFTLKDMSSVMPHPDDPLLGVLIENLVDQGAFVNIDDRDWNVYSLNPSCNSKFSMMHDRTWLIHHATPQVLECAFRTDMANYNTLSLPHGRDKLREAYVPLKYDFVQEVYPTYYENGTLIRMPHEVYNVTQAWSGPTVLVRDVADEEIGLQRNKHENSQSDFTNFRIKFANGTLSREFDSEMVFQKFLIAHFINNFTSPHYQQHRTMRMFPVSLPPQRDLPNLCHCGLEVYEEPDEQEIQNGTEFWYPRQRFNPELDWQDGDWDEHEASEADILQKLTDKIEKRSLEQELEAV
jgi:hypothetical protein